MQGKAQRNIQVKTVYLESVLFTLRYSCILTNGGEMGLDESTQFRLVGENCFGMNFMVKVIGKKTLEWERIHLCMFAINYALPSIRTL